MVCAPPGGYPGQQPHAQSDIGYPGGQQPRVPSDMQDVPLNFHHKAPSHPRSPSLLQSPSEVGVVVTRSILFNAMSPTLQKLYVEERAVQEQEHGVARNGAELRSRVRTHDQQIKQRAEEAYMKNQLQEMRYERRTKFV